ncbi:HAMP domain-containing sensor histidine kinase [Actinocrispum sp. NPDC049592]|uniref:sensor histidine kinase n=1 Tax=Actinocrispum sp. NPDC049592 TaxID=3154835 RepID=UPI00342A8D94
MLSEWWRRWPVGLRSAVAAGLIAGLLLTAGALWLRSTIADIDRERIAARIAGGETVLTAVRSTILSGQPPPVMDTPYEILGGNGTVLPSSNPDLRAVEESQGPATPPPQLNDPAGTQVLTSQDLDYHNDLWGIDLPSWTVIAETIPTPPALVSTLGERLRINVLVTRPDEHPLPGLDRVLWPGVPGAALLVALVAWLSAAHALRPVERIRRQAKEISATALHRRITLPGRWSRGWSIGMRAAVAAGLIAAVPFVVGAVWMRHTLDVINTARMMSNAEAADAALDALKVLVPQGKSIPTAEAYRFSVGQPLSTPDNYRLLDQANVDGTEIYTYEKLIPGWSPAPEMDRVLWPGVPAGIALVGFVAWLATTRALAPVERIRKQAAEISSQALDVRVPVPPTRDAIARLAVTLNETLDRLENSVRTQRQFIADAAHELRSPIASLRTVLEVANDHPQSADWPAVVRDAVIDTQRLHSLADDLLLLATLDSAIPLRMTGIDLAELVKSEVGGRVEVIVDGPAPMIGDVRKVSRLLRNLVDNAERHAAARVTVTVRATPMTVSVEVADDGPGIPVEDRERVFDRFTRLDEARDSDAGGTGLGLAIAREIAHLHGGDITVADTGPGATFVARFPRD